MHKDVPIAIAAGAASAILGLALLTGNPLAALAGNLAALPVLLAGFSLGPSAAAIAALSGVVLAGLFSGPVGAATFAAIVSFPAWLLVRIALMPVPVPPGTAAQGHAMVSAGTVVGSIGVYGGLLFLIGAFLQSGSDAGFAGSIEQILPEMLRIPFPGTTDDVRAMVAHAAAAWFPGAIGGSWVFIIVMNAVLAIALLNRSGKSLRPRPRYSDLTLPDAFAWPLVASAAAALLFDGDVGYTFRNLTLVLATPYFLAGLAVVHTMARRVAYGRGLLFVFYIIILMSVWCMLAVAGLGMIDQWAGVRRRFAAPDDNDEETT